MTIFDGLLGRIFSDGTLRELTSGINFVTPLSATPRAISSTETVLDIEVSGGSSANPGFFGGGADGPLSASAGTLTLTQPTYYSTVVLTGTAKINRAGFPLYIQEFTSNVVDAINDTGSAGGAGVPDSSAGNDGAAELPATDWFGVGQAGGDGGNPTTGAGNNGAPGTDSGSAGLGGAGGAGGQGGTGAGGAGGTPGIAGTVGDLLFRFLTLVENVWYRNGGTIDRVDGGAGGGGGSSGAGDGGGGSGGSGGGGGGGARPGLVRIGIVHTSASTPAGVISARGGPGGAGATTASGSGDKGGGAGGGGGGGGYLHVVIGEVIGPSVDDYFSTEGGAGGLGSVGKNSGTAGASGAAGGPGKIDLIHLSENTSLRSASGSADLVGSG